MDFSPTLIRKNTSAAQPSVFAEYGSHTCSLRLKQRKAIKITGETKSDLILSIFGCKILIWQEYIKGVDVRSGVNQNKFNLLFRNDKKVSPRMHKGVKKCSYNLEVYV